MAQRRPPVRFEPPAPPTSNPVRAPRRGPYPSAIQYSDGTSRELTAEQAQRVYLALSEEDLLSPNEAASLLGVSRQMVVRWIQERRLTDVPAGSHHRVRRTEVLALKAERSRAGSQARQLVRARAENSDAARRTAIARAAAAAAIAERDT